METIGWSERERRVLSATLGELSDRCFEQVAWSLGLEDEETDDLRALEDTEECQQLAGLLSRELDAWQTVFASLTAPSVAAVMGAIGIAVRAIQTALDGAHPSTPLPRDLVKRLETILDELVWISQELEEDKESV